MSEIDIKNYLRINNIASVDFEIYMDKPFVVGNDSNDTITITMPEGSEDSMYTLHPSDEQYIDVSQDDEPKIIIRKI